MKSRKQKQKKSVKGQIHLHSSVFLCQRNPAVDYIQIISQSVGRSFSTASSIVNRGEAGACLQQTMGGRWGTPWTGRQSIAGQHGHTQNKQPLTHSFTPKGATVQPSRLLVSFHISASGM
ncbi:hypothetical protein XENORESO_007833 [Xenotaenia resolanae]|uniref:Uncharacterized protein n=1 Tax=Xenotaenia resolanae TaxID=208358 RepID=A0ABV0WNW8_9TELE